MTAAPLPLNVVVIGRMRPLRSEVSEPSTREGLMGVDPEVRAFWLDWMTLHGGLCPKCEGRRIVPYWGLGDDLEVLVCDDCGFGCSKPQGAPW